MPPLRPAANTDVYGQLLDMSGYEGVMFILPVEDSVATGIATLQAQSDTDPAGGSMAAVPGAVATKTSAVNDDLNDGCLVVDFYKPAKRYVRAEIKSATANIAFGTCLALQYSGRKKPTVQDVAEVLASALSVSGDAA